MEVAKLLLNYYVLLIIIKFYILLQLFYNNYKILTILNTSSRN